MPKLLFPRPPEWASRHTLEEVKRDTSKYLKELVRVLDEFMLYGAGNQGAGSRLTVDFVPYQTGAATVPTDTPVGPAIRGWQDTGTGKYYLELYISGVGWKKIEVT
jgi:hypothetical protein